MRDFLAGLLVLACVCWTTFVEGQGASSDACSYALANQYAVNSSCVFQTLNKPAAYVANYNPGTCNSGAYDDAFGWFQATGTSTTITFDPATADDAILHVFTGACPGPYTQIACADAGLGGGNETVTITTTPGTNYLIRTQNYNTNAAMNGSVCVYSLVPPANDNPCSATPLTVGTSCTFSNSTNAGASATAGVPAPSCTTYGGGDVWFTAVVPANGRLVIDSNTGVITDSGMALYTSATNCSGTLTEVECDDDDSGNGAMSFIDRSGLTPLSTVYIRMWEYGGDNNGSFQICVYSPPPPPPSCGTTVYDPGGAAGNYANNANYVVTYCPTTAGDVVTLTFTAFATEAGLDVVTIYNGPSTASPQLGSFSGATNPGAITSTAVDGCLTLRFTSDFSAVMAGWTANVTCATPPPPVPACGTTVYDPGGAAGNYGNNQVYTVTYCPTNPAHVVTLNFTAFNTENNFDIVTLYNGSSITDPVIAVLSGTTLPGSFSGTVPGACITLQFISDGSFNYAGWAASVTCAVPPPPPAGDCIYVLTLADAFGDGWGSSYVTLNVAGPPGNTNANYTVGAGVNQVVFGVYLGQIVTLTYNNSGPFQGDNSYALSFQGGGALFNSGSPPASGISYLSMVNCVPPPAAPQDCNGGVTLCNGQSFNNSSNNTGNVIDLNATNQGCLSAGERQGTWYYFSPSAPGTIGFTINPTAPTDYDFAVWGPMTSVTCPPPGPPLRCSFAAPQGDTGAGNGAIDPSEGAGGDRWVSPFNVLTGQVYILYVDNFSTNGQSFNLSWQLSAGASLDCSVLPIGEVVLDAFPKGSDVEVHWTTTFERGSSHFIVERSVDASVFAPVGRLEAAGSSNALTEYVLLDQTVSSGHYYYRILAVANDGSQQYSQVVSVLLHSAGAFMVVPDPVENGAEVWFKGSHEGLVRLNVMDACGRLVWDQSTTLKDGDQRFTLPPLGLHPGSYVLSVLTAEGTLFGRCSFIQQ